MQVKKWKEQLDLDVDHSHPSPSDNSNPRVGADHGVDFDWSRQSRDCPDVSAKILNSDYSVQHCNCISLYVYIKLYFWVLTAYGYRIFVVLMYYVS